MVLNVTYTFTALAPINELEVGRGRGSLESIAKWWNHQIKWDSYRRICHLQYTDIYWYTIYTLPCIPISTYLPTSTLVLFDLVHYSGTYYIIHTSIWWCPKIGIPPNHPFLDGIFHYKPSIVGCPHFTNHPYIFSWSLNLRSYGPFHSHEVYILHILPCIFKRYYLHIKHITYYILHTTYYIFIHHLVHGPFMVPAEVPSGVAGHLRRLDRLFGSA